MTMTAWARGYDYSWNRFFDIDVIDPYNECTKEEIEKYIECFQNEVEKKLPNKFVWFPHLSEIWCPYCCKIEVEDFDWQEIVENAGIVAMNKMGW